MAEEDDARDEREIRSRSYLRAEPHQIDLTFRQPVRPSVDPTRKTKERAKPP